MLARNAFALLMIGLMMVPGGVAEGDGESAAPADSAESEVSPAPQPEVEGNASESQQASGTEEEGIESPGELPCPTQLGPLCRFVFFCPEDAPQGDGNLPVSSQTTDATAPGVGVATAYDDRQGFYAYKGGGVDLDGCQ